MATVRIYLSSGQTIVMKDARLTMNSVGDIPKIESGSTQIALLDQDKIVAITSEDDRA